MSGNAISLPVVLGVLFLFFLVLIAASRRKHLFMAILIKEDRERRLEIKTNAKWRSSEIWYDGSLAATVTRRELIAGKDVKLSDGSTLNIKLPSPNLQPTRLAITRNGQPLGQEVSGFENQAAINGAATMILLIGMINLVIGAGSMFVHIEALTPLNLGWLNILFGVVFLVLGIIARRKSALAMILFTVIFGLDAMSAVLVYLQTGNYYIFGVVLMRIALLTPVLFGLSEIYHQKKSWLAGFFKWLAFALIVIALAGLVMLFVWIAGQGLQIRNLLKGK